MGNQNFYSKKWEIPWAVTLPYFQGIFFAREEKWIKIDSNENIKKQFLIFFSGLKNNYFATFSGLVLKNDLQFLPHLPQLAKLGFWSETMRNVLKGRTPDAKKIEIFGLLFFISSDFNESRSKIRFRTTKR